MTSPTQQPGKDAAPRKGRLALGSLANAQEAGLVLVIILMAAVLTIFGGTKTKRVVTDVPDGAQIFEVNQAGEEVPLGTLPPADNYGYVVKHNATSKSYPASQGWDYRESTNNGTTKRELLGRVQANKFLEIQNIVLVAKDASFIAVMAVGMTGVIILAGIDLSVGSIYAIAAMVGAMLLSALPPETGLIASVLLGTGVCCIVGGAAGAANGLMIVGLRVHPFVITLGTMVILRGLTVVVSGAESVTGFPAPFQAQFYKAEFFGVHPIPVVIMVVVALIGAFTLTRTVFGRRIYAIGGNETAARYAGIKVGRVKIWVYTLTGVLAGLSGAMYIGYFGAADPNAGNAYELRVIAAAVIGGASLMGGRGSAIGAVLGAIVVELINNSMVIFGLPSEYDKIVMGTAIIIAVVIDQTRTRLSQRR